MTVRHLPPPDLAPVPAMAGCIGKLGGNFLPAPSNGGNLSPKAAALLHAVMRGISPGSTRDYHTHLLSLETRKNGGYINPRMLSWKHPLDRLKTYIYMSAARVDDLAKADAQYLGRLVQLIRAIPDHGKHYLLAFDQHYDSQGTPIPAKSEFHVPNDYVWKVSSKYPDLFIPAISVHPHRSDAVAELERWGRLGVKLVKWLPNAQGMDASEARHDAYYAKLKEHGMTLLAHVGEEQAVHAKAAQRLGNPLLFRRALNRGVRVLMAHAGSLGLCEDLDDASRRKVPCYSLVLRLLREPAYKKLLAADISAMTQFNRLPNPLIALLGAADVHDRLVNGSDYPLPAINALIRLGKLVDHGLLDKADVEPLREIYRRNPLLFDFALKRRLRHPQTGKGFPPEVFLERPGVVNR